MRLSMHNFNPANSALNNREILKGLDVTFLANETASPITIHNYGWREHDNRNRNPLSWLNNESPENLLDIGIDLAPPITAGEHLIQIEYIDLYGKLLSAEAWYLGVALIMVLRETAQIIQKNIRVSDKFVRWGGEEFILLCDATNVKQALLIAEKIRVSIEAAKMTHNDGNISITASIGIGVAKSDENFDDLFQRTDQALYRAKNMGRNCVALSESDR